MQRRGDGTDLAPSDDARPPCSNTRPENRCQRLAAWRLAISARTRSFVPMDKSAGRPSSAGRPAAFRPRLVLARAAGACPELLRGKGHEFLLLTRWKVFHGGFDFGERAHGRKIPKPGATGNRCVVLLINLETCARNTIGSYVAERG